MYFGVHAFGLFVAAAGRHRHAGGGIVFGFSISGLTYGGSHRRDCADKVAGCRGVNGGAVVSAGIACAGIEFY